MDRGDPADPQLWDFADNRWAGFCLAISLLTLLLLSVAFRV